MQKGKTSKLASHISVLYVVLYFILDTRVAMSAIDATTEGTPFYMKEYFIENLLRQYPDGTFKKKGVKAAQKQFWTEFQEHHPEITRPEVVKIQRLCRLRRLRNRQKSGTSVREPTEEKLHSNESPFICLSGRDIHHDGRGTPQHKVKVRYPEPKVISFEKDARPSKERRKKPPRHDESEVIPDQRPCRKHPVLLLAARKMSSHAKN